LFHKINRLKRLLFFITGALFSFLFVLPLSAEEDEYMKTLQRELNQEELFLEGIIENLISRGDREFIETMIYRMGYERAKEKIPRLFFLTQFGGGPMVSGGIGLHIFNRQFYSYLSGGYTIYGKYKNNSFSFVNEVKFFDIYLYKRHHIDFILGGNISYFSEPGTFISSVTIKQVFYIYELDLFGLSFSPYTVFNLYFDRSKPVYQFGIGINYYPWE